MEVEMNQLGQAQFGMGVDIEVSRVVGIEGIAQRRVMVLLCYKMSYYDNMERCVVFQYVIVNID